MRPEQTTDVELLHAAANSDEQALALLYDRYRVILFGLLVRILKSHAEAEDVLQEVFVQVWKKAGDFDQERGRPFTWLVTLTRSRAIDRLRVLGASARARSAVAQNTPEQMVEAASNAFLSEQRALVRNALAQLPSDQRQTLMLAYFEGLTQSEIAAQTATPLGTVKTRMRSGMIKLRKLLADSEGKFWF